MSAIARFCKFKGCAVSGYDRTRSELTDKLSEEGIAVHYTDDPSFIPGDANDTLVIYTPAVPDDMGELVYARAHGYHVLKRSQMLGELTRGETCLAVAGTHGKTTVTSMITQILKQGGMDITAYIGGKLPIIGGSGCVGTSDTMVCEACEFVDHFLKLSPDIAVVLNVDADHLDYFGTLDNVIASFRKFCTLAGRVIANGDDANTRKAIDGLDKEIITFGYSEDNDWYAKNVNKVNGLLTEFEIYHNGELFTKARLHIPGVHNVLNAVAAAAAAYMSGADAEMIAAGLDSFHGAKRRFEKYGEVGGITVCDDYGHHPAELEATLRAARDMGFRQVWAVFQPFTFSRTALLLDDFIRVLSIPDNCIITAIMGSREKNTYNIYDKDIGEKVKGAVWFGEQDHDKNFELCAEYAAEHAQSGDLILTMGCGDVNKCANLILEKLKKKYNS